MKITVERIVTKGDMFWVNGFDENNVEFSASAHKRYQKVAYAKLKSLNLQEGDLIDLDVKQSGDFFNINAVEKLKSASKETRKSSGGSNSSYNNANFREPDELIMIDCINSSITVHNIAVSGELSKIVKKGMTLEAITNSILDTAIEFYKQIKDPMKNSVIESDTSDVKSNSDDIPQEDLPGTVEEGSEE